MGQAKQRGTYSQRVSLAQARNQALEKQLKGPALDFANKYGVQRLATRLTAAGMLALQVSVKQLQPK